MPKKLPVDPSELAESPISADAIRRGIAANPAAVHALFGLLDLIDLDDPARALEQESLTYGALQGGTEHEIWLATQRPSESQKTGGVRVFRAGNCIDVCLDRLDARNAIDRSMRDALYETFAVAALDPDVTRIRLCGAGKAFCVGADLNEFGTTRDPATAHAIRIQTLPAHMIIRCATKFEADVQGACIGAGLEMAAFAARFTATPDAWFQLPELAMGLIPGAGGCVSVTRRIGRKRMAALVLSGRRINARTALDWGLIDAIVDNVAVDDRHANLVSG